MMKPTIRPCRTTDVGRYVSALINQPWDRHGLHCWPLARKVQFDLFGRDLPAIVDVAPAGGCQGRSQRRQLFAKHAASSGWIVSQAPAHGAIALMHRAAASPDAIEHAGVYLDLDGGGVLHSDHAHGVVFDNLRELTSIRLWRPIFLVPKAA